MRMIKIGKAAEILGVSIQTLHKWEETGELVPDRKSKAGTRYYDADRLLNLSELIHLRLAMRVFQATIKKRI